VFVPDLVGQVVGQMDTIQQDTLYVNTSGYIQAASRGAVKKGVRIAMRIRQAHALSPDAEIRSFDEASFLELDEAIETALSTFTNRIEAVFGFGYVGKRRKLEQPLLPASTACYYLDLGKLRGGDAVVIAQHTQSLLKDTLALDSLIGLSRGKFPALVASRTAQIDHPKLIQLGDEGDFLAPFAVNILPLDREASRRLEVFGIRTIGALARLPRAAVVAQFGKEGGFLHELSHGNDHRRVIARPHKPSEHLRKCLDGAVDNRLALEALLKEMGCTFEQELRSKEFTTRSLELVLQLDNGKLLKKRHALREPTQDGGLLGRQLIRMFSQMVLPCGAVSVEAAAHDLAAPVMQQLDLFASPAPTTNRLSDLIEMLSARVASEQLFCVTHLDPEHWLIEQRFVLEPVDAA
jgi:nucleotidyltransferase/DNA polymerase involved in DNA repair